MLRLIALVLPLCLDTFVVAAALGASGLVRSARLRVTLVLASFEALMPLVGVGVGQALGRAVGSYADYVASGALIAFGAFLLFGNDDDDEAERAVLLSRARGIALIGLGVGVSFDELAVGFSIGLLDVPIGWAIALIAIQAFAAAQFGVRIGAHFGGLMRGRLERLTAVLLIAFGLVLLIGHLVR